MASLFRRPKNADVLHDEDLLLAESVRDVSSMVPLSARTFDDARFTPMQVPEELDEDDEDVKFLSSLAEAVAEDKPAPKRTEPRRAPSPIAAVETVTLPSERDDLAAFRDVGKGEDERPPLTRVVKVPDVEIGDLLEDLDTTMAALRRKRAA